MSKPVSPEKKQEWREKILQQQSSGLSIEKWCREHQVKSHLFYYWKDRLFPKNSLTHFSFTELTDSKKDIIALEYRSFRIYLDRYFDPSFLKRCLEALKNVRC